MPTHAETMKTAIESVLEGRIDSDVESYTIDGRQITKIPIQQLMYLHKYYSALAQQEANAAAVEAGGGNPNRIKVRFP